MRFLLTLTAILVFAVPSLSYAYDIKAVEQRFEVLEAALNNTAEPLEKIKVLHETISEDATFELHVNNPALNAAQNATALKMDKAGYINSFLMGASYIADYQADIQTLSYKPAQKGEKASSTIMLFESGKTLNPYDLSAKGKDFVSRTTCQNVHGDDLEIISSTCKTDVSYNKHI